LGKYLNKGKRIYIEGRLRTRKWEDSEWKERFSTEVIVDNFIFLDQRWARDEESTPTEPVVATDDEEVPF
jgi:single-strand DNA-binding protein